ncbi:4Fe-4S binding protein [Methanolobus profundi]|uniref:4Fe-4S binding domain-containing protein n=1 Tax=Methanolobus profundi TaxID=487685 RepID=A0A1I4P968_9EURY|nr:4Fe-4S binding protein [Methanolobus profundi]SFM24150.1 4Fe-4S binding domain-containing protein [Methanolobus profundi]
MLKITPYLGILVIIVSIAGLWFPLLGYFLLLVFATLLITSISRGRWFCGNLCPRGSFNDFWVGKITRNKKIPAILRSYWVRIPIFMLMMGFMGYRLLSTQGLINQIGMVFVIMCLVTTTIALVTGAGISPRTWCTFCPMGTVQNLIGGKKYQLRTDESKCINCNKCEKVCPMQLDVHTNNDKPDCIKCGRCITACPTKALAFKA